MKADFYFYFYMSYRKVQNGIQYTKFKLNKPLLLKKSDIQAKSIEMSHQKMDKAQKKLFFFKNQSFSIRHSLQKSYNSPRISTGLKNILSFERKVAKLNTTFSENNLKIKNRQSQVLAKTTRKSTNKLRESKNYNLVPAQKMTLDFQRQLRKIRQNFKLKYNSDSIIQKLDRFQIFSSTMTGIQTIENKDCIKVGHGICILCDGHGSNGKQISQFVCNSIFEKCLKKKKQNQLNVKTIQEIFQKITFELQFTGIDISFSGATCILVVCFQHEILVANLGNSMAILINNTRLLYLSNKHCIDTQNQRKRIQKEGGILRQTQKMNYKIYKAQKTWTPNENRNYNLTITRQFGNKIARRNGLISEPQITAYQPKYNEEILIIASNSLFQIIKYEQVVQIIKSAQVFDADQRQKLCQLILQQAISRAGRELDDISLILIFI